jgi:tetratricopeptide (TPR) repeat protein
MRSSSKILSIVVLIMAACGGGGDSAPGPLSKHFDDSYIAAIPVEQQQNVVQASNDWSLAKRQVAKAEADLNDLNTQLTIVRNDQKATKLGVDSAAANKKAAEASHDTGRMNDATRDQHTAEGLAKAADARVKYYEAYQDFLKATLYHAQANMYWREAQYENAKAQLGQRNNIAPKGVSYDSFAKQEQDRQKAEESLRGKVDTARGKAQSARDSWRSAQESADRDNGHPSNLPDPMAKS